MEKQKQNGETKAKYGSNLINELSKQLTADFGVGFSARNLRNMRQFYYCFPIWQTVSAKLSWSHYLLILKLENEKAREYYIQESIASNWSVRSHALKRHSCTTCSHNLPCIFTHH